MDILKYYRENNSSIWISNNLLFDNKPIILSSMQKKFIDNKYSNTIITSRRSGKTFAIVINALERLYREENEHIKIITFSKKAAEDIFDNYFTKFTTKAKSVLNYNKQLMRIYNIKTDSDITIHYPQSIGSARGLRSSIIYIDDYYEDKYSYSVFIDEYLFLKKKNQDFYNTYSKEYFSLVKQISSLY